MLNDLNDIFVCSKTFPHAFSNLTAWFVYRSQWPRFARVIDPFNVYKINKGLHTLNYS